MSEYPLDDDYQMISIRANCLINDPDDVVWIDVVSWGIMKHLTSLMLFLLPLTITYAIVSSIGTEGNHYSAPE
jgi:hypothetical protein